MNKIYRVIWNTALRLWVVASELAKGKQKSTKSRSSSCGVTPLCAPFFPVTRFSTLALSLFVVLGGQPAYAITQVECDNLGAAVCTKAATPAALLAALGSASTASTILLTANITIPAGGYSFYMGTNRPNLTIDGGGTYDLTYTDLALNFIANGSTANPARLNIVDFDSLISTYGAAAVNRFIYVNNATANIITNIDNINTIADGKLVSMGADSAALQPNNSPVTIGNINTDIGITFGAYRQVFLGSDVTFTGRFHTFQLANGGYPAVLWTNGSALNSIIRLTSTADVQFTGAQFTNGQAYSGLTNAHNYSYFIDDGARFGFQMTGGSQNLLATDNNGLKIGTYTPGGGFGSGAILTVVPPSGNGISNASSTAAASAIYNGPTSNNEVIYNLAPGSEIKVTAGNSGIVATKTTGTGAMYIRSGATISDGTTNTTTGTGISISAGSSGEVIVRNEVGGTIRKATGISVTDTGSSPVTITNAGTLNSTTAGILLAHDGSGVASITNSGTINSSIAGLSLSSTTAGKAVTVNGTGGTINASGGSGITMGNNIVLDLTNGTIATTGAATGLTIGTTNAGIQKLTGTIFNLGGTGSAIAKGASGSVELRNTQFNATSGTVFTALTGLNFLQGVANNAINLTGTGVVTGISSNASLDFSPSYLTINVNNTAATGISTTGATAVTVGPNTAVNASGGAAAITFGNSLAQSLTNNGVISGSVSMGSSGNTIINNGTLGALTSTGGIDTLTLNADSISNGIIDLGAGNNIVNINDGATINTIHTGIGNDIFTINNLTNGSTTTLGALNAGGGNNTLNFNNSIRTLASGTRLQNFTNINLTNNSGITLNDANNITSGNVNLSAGNTLLFGNTYNGAFDAILTGGGKAEIVSAGDVTLGSDNTFSGDWQIDSGGILNANALTQLGSAAIALSGTLNFNNNGTFNNVLTGAGFLNIDGTNSAFNFGASVGSAFSGTVDISNVTFNLSGLNSSAVNNATLSNSAGSTLQLDIGTHNVGNLVFNGGILQFSPGGIISTGSGTGLGSLSVANNSLIQADPTLLAAGNILDLNAGVFTDLVQSGNTLSVADLAKLQLQDLFGNNLSSGTEANYEQNSQVVAVNTYDFNLVSNYAFSNLGLSIQEQLIQSDLQSGQTLTLTSNGATNTTLTSQLIGAGNLAIGADNTALTLSNNLNSYSGSTTVNAGSLTLGASNSLGTTSLLDVAAGATVALAGHEQTVGALSNAGTLSLAGGILNITNGGTSSSTGGLVGGGALNINGGTFTVTGANSGLLASTTIDANAITTLSGAGDLGSGAVEVAGVLNVNAAKPAFSNQLGGVGIVNANAAIGLTGNNNFSGIFKINANGSIAVGNAGNLGNAVVDLTSASAQLLLNSFNGNLANTLLGVASATVRLGSGATINLTGANGSYAGLFDVTGNSTLTVSQNTHLGSGSVSVASGSLLVFDAFAGGAVTALNNMVGGAGSWVLRNSNITLAGSNNASGLTGLIDINSASSLTLNGGTTLNSAAVLKVNGADSILNLTDSGAFTLNNALTGAGQVNVDTANAAFNFGAGVGSAFTGNVTLNNTTFLLVGTNTSALTAATLTTSAGSVTSVGAANQTVGDLVLNGGTTVFASGSLITTDTLNVMAASTVRVDPAGVASGNLLDQDNGVSTTLVNSSNSLSPAALALLTLQDSGGNNLGSGTVSDYQQGGNVVSKNTYNYSLTSAPGLRVSTQLTQADLQSGQTLTLSSLGATNTTLMARLTGVGNLAIGADNVALTLNNSLSNYTGTTTVAGGSVALTSDNAFGMTSLLTINSGASVNLYDASQTVGALTNQGTVTLDPSVLTSGLLTNTGVIDLAGGTLTLLAGGTSTASGGLTGAGTLNVNGGTLALSAANSGLSAATQIASGATVAAGAANALGTSAVTVGGTLDLNTADTLTNLLDGAGRINTNAALILSGNNGFTGNHEINAGGRLTVGTAGNLGSSLARVNLSDATSELVLNGMTGPLANNLSGVLWHSEFGHLTRGDILTSLIGKVIS